MHDIFYPPAHRNPIPGYFMELGTDNYYLSKFECGQTLASHGENERALAVFRDCVVFIRELSEYQGYSGSVSDLQRALSDCLEALGQHDEADMELAILRSFKGLALV